MINFSNMKNTTLIGRLIRKPLKFIPNNLAIPVVQGHNRGFKWYKGSGTNGYWLGTYEYPKQKKILEFCKPQMTCWDIGAHVGFYTLMMSKLTEVNGKVIAFEPDSQNLVWLKKHIELNHITNVTVAQLALSNYDGISYFIHQSNSSTSSLSTEKSKYLVSVYKGDTLVEKFKFSPPDLIKIDVEGAEFNVLHGLTNTLTKYRPVIFVVIDDLERMDQTLSLLKELKYKCKEIPGMLNEYICI